MSIDLLPEEERQKRLDALQKLSEFGEMMRESMDRIEKEQEEYWNTFSKEQQLDLFCCIVRRLVKGELEERGSYRHVLYDTFGFGMESYTLALDAGFMNLHNSIFTDEEEKKLVNDETEACARIVEEMDGMPSSLIEEKIRERIAK